jgi:hypothetical protein
MCRSFLVSSFIVIAPLGADALRHVAHAADVFVPFPPPLLDFAAQVVVVVWIVHGMILQVRANSANAGPNVNAASIE